MMINGMLCGTQNNQHDVRDTISSHLQLFAGFCDRRRTLVAANRAFQCSSAIWAITRDWRVGYLKKRSGRVGYRDPVGPCWLVDTAWGAYGSWRLSAQMRAYCRVDPPDLTKRSPTQWVTYEGIELLWQLKKSQRQKQSFCDKDIDPLNGAQPSIIIKIVIINNMNIKINTVDSSSAPPFYTSRKWLNFFHFFMPPSTR